MEQIADKIHGMKLRNSLPLDCIRILRVFLYVFVNIWSALLYVNDIYRGGEESEMALPRGAFTFPIISLDHEAYSMGRV